MGCSRMVCAALLALWMSALSSTAMADDLDKARIYYKKGNDLFDAGRHLEAITEFRTALRYAPKVPAIHKNLARTYILVKEWELALKHFNTYLQLRPNAKDREKILSEKQFCLKSLGVSSEAELLARRKGELKLTVSIDQAEVLINDRPVGTSPLQTLKLKPGQYMITVRKKGFKPISRAVSINPGQTLALMIELNKMPEPITPVTPPKRKPGKKADLKWIFAWVTAGTGVAFLATGIAMNALAAKDQSNILNSTRDSSDTIVGKTQTDAESAQKKAKTKNIVSGVMYALAAASFGASIYLFIASTRERRERLTERKLNFGPSYVPGGMVFTLDGRF
ncbi:MAG: PEGA domain-containing protein [Myxococcales bacterium]|nr:PEGA domain-containing protein [Myxococcales bacterium]